MNKNLWFLILVFSLGWAMTWTGDIQAASGLADVRDIEQQILSVRQRLQQVQPLVDESRNERAVELLNQGARNLEDAERALSRPDEIMARNFVRRALELINAAAQEAARNYGINQEQVERELIRLREIVRSAEEVLAQAQVPAARALLDRAQEEAERSRQLFEQRLYQQALERIKRASDLALQARGMAVRNSLDSQDNLEQILQDLDRLAQQVQAAVSSVPTPSNVTQIINNALQMRQRAEESLQQGRLERANDQARRARELLQHALRLSGQAQEDFDPLQRATREMERVRALQAEALKAAGNAPDALIQSLLDQLQATLTQAEQALENRNPNLALQLLQRANDLAVQILFRVNNAQTSRFPDLATVARMEYNQLIHEILPDALAHVRRTAVEARNSRAVQYLEQAQAAAERAEQLLQQDRLEQALQEINTSKTLARKAIEEANRFGQTGQ